MSLAEKKMTSSETTAATMGIRASAVAKHREEHPENGQPQLSDAAKEAAQGAVERIRTLFRKAS